MYKILVVVSKNARKHLKSCFNSTSECQYSFYEDSVLDFDISKVLEFDAVILVLAYPMIEHHYDTVTKFRNAVKKVLVVADLHPDFKKMISMQTLKVDFYFDLKYPYEVCERRIRYMLFKYKNAQNTVCVYKDISIDLATREVRRENKIIYLGKKEFDLLYVMMMNPGLVFSKDKLLEQVWDMNASTIHTNTVQTHICKLRKKLDSDYSEKRLHTITSIGYKLS